jgi:hypothetical protein
MKAAGGFLAALGCEGTSQRLRDGPEQLTDHQVSIHSSSVATRNVDGAGLGCLFRA